MVTAQTPPAPPPELDTVLWERYSSLLGIKRRIYFLRAFVNELERVTRGKPFTIRNDILWTIVLDSRDKCVIDLFSLSVEMRHGVRPLAPGARERVSRSFLNKRGVFFYLLNHYRERLTRTYVAHPSDDEYEVAHHTRGKAEVFERLFPGCTTESPSPADIENLCERFRLRMFPLGQDRNKNRAHAYEGDRGTAPILSIAELEELFKYCEDLLESLSLLSAGAAYARSNMFHASCGDTAADLIDQILFGDLDDVVRLTGTRTRDELYARLHEIDDTSRGDEEEAERVGVRRELRFNDRQFDPRFEGYLEMLPPRRR